MKNAESRWQLLCGLFVFGFLVLFWRKLLLFGLIPFHGDLFRFSLPAWVVGKNLLLESGSLLWDPFRNLGQPFLAIPQNQALYPIRFFQLFLDYLDYSRILVVFHTLLSGSFTFLLVRHYTKDLYAAFLSGMGMAFGGFLVARIVYPVDFATAAWAPVILFYLVSKKPIHLGVSFTFQWLAGFPPLVIVTSVLCLIFILIEKQKEKFWKTLVMGGLIALGLSSVQLIPFIELLNESIRSLTVESAVAVQNSLRPLDVLKQLLLPSYLMNRFFPMDHYHGTFFLGPILFGLFLWGMWKGPKPIRTLGLLGLMGLLLACGNYVGLTIPLFKYPTNWLLVYVVTSLVVAGMGLSKVKKKELKYILMGFALLDLMGYSLKPIHPWGNLSFLMEAPIRFQDLMTPTPKGRILHQEKILTESYKWNMYQEDSWVLLKAMMAPSYGVLHGFKEVASHHSLTSKRNIAFRRRLLDESNNRELLNLARVGTRVILTGESEHLDTPKFIDVRVFKSEIVKPRVFFKDNSEPIILEKDKPGQINATTKGTGLAVLSEAYFPGWKAEVNGEPVEVEAVEDMFIGVSVDIPNSKICINYLPSSFIIGSLVSIFTLCGLFILIRWKRELFEI